jgi:alkylation response protein AidB-like acyl-CoA dehydrogenase
VRGGAAADFGDLELAANAIGVCDAALDSAWRCARTQKRGGRLLADHQIVQLKLNQMHVKTEALRSFALRSAAEMDQGVLGSPSAVLVMNFSSDVIQEVTRLNLEIHGAAGGVADALADKLVRDSIIWTHLAGDATQRLKVVRRLAARG